MGRTGLREAAAVLLAAIAVSLAAGFYFARPGGGEPRQPVTSGADATASPTVPRPSPTPTSSSPTPTPEPRVLDLDGVTWQVRIVARRDGSEEVAGAADLDRLDFEIPTFPFPDVPDDSWLLRAEAMVDVPPGGPWALRLRYDGELTVVVDGRVVASFENPEEAQEVTVPLAASDERAYVIIEVADTGGPVVLQLPPD